MSKLVKGIYIIPFLALLLNIIALPILLSLLPQETANKSIVNCMYGLMVLDAVFIAALIHNAVRLNKRIQGLNENVERLEQAQPIYNQIDGNDELAQIDLHIHKVSDRHDEALSFRRSVLKLMTHDLKTPLSSNLLALDLLTETEKDLSEAGILRVKQVKSSLERQVNVLNNLLLIEQLESGQVEVSPTPENLAELITKSLDSLSSAANTKNISFELNIPNTYAKLDREKILLVIGSYLSNAIKFSPVAGKIIVRLLKEDDGVRFEVQDYGMGVDAEESVKLFQKFAKSAAGRKAGGAGLSLAIGKKIIQAHGGKVGVASKTDAGSTFWFSIPSAIAASSGTDDEL